MSRKTASDVPVHVGMFASNYWNGAAVVVIIARGRIFVFLKISEKIGNEDLFCYKFTMHTIINENMTREGGYG